MSQRTYKGRWCAALGVDATLSVASVLTTYRVKSALTLKQVAAGARLSPKLISAVERGRRSSGIKLATLAKLLDFYGVSLATFARDLEAELVWMRKETA